jgi:hypothetical protein
LTLGIIWYMHAGIGYCCNKCSEARLGTISQERGPEPDGTERISGVKGLTELEKYMFPWTAHVETVVCLQRKHITI